MSSPSKIVIFNDTHGWHSDELVNALKPYNISATLCDLADCAIDLDHPTGLMIHGFEDRLPAAAMVRGIAPGTLEQITLRMDVLHTLAELHIPVFNPARAIEHTVDKARTSLRLHLAGLRTPKTWSCENKTLARTIAKKQFELGLTLVIKPLFGCQGKGIEQVKNLTEFDQLSVVGDAFYMQEYIPPIQDGLWQDWRLMVVDGEVCAAMSRHSQHWITNFAQGASCSATTITEDMAELAIAASKAVEADYAGVDLIRDQHGQFVVLEVNSVPAWKGLKQASGIDVAAHLAKAIAKRVHANQNSHVINETN